MQFLLDFVNSSTQAEIDKFLTDNNCSIITEYSAFEKCYLVSSSSEPTIDTQLIETIVRNDLTPIQLMAFPQISFSTTDNDQWWKIASFAKPDFNLPVQTYDRRGATSTVYIVDSGVKADHIDLSNAAITNLYSFNNDFTDYNGHGTALASVISGDICGVTAAKIKSVKIFQNGVDTLQSHLVAAFNAIINDVISNPNSFPIVNISWNIPRNTFIEDKIQSLRLLGVIVIVAAGNNGMAIDDVTPAAMQDVLTVGSYGQNFLPSTFSNYTGPVSTTPMPTNGGALDIWAPGEDIKVALINGGFGLISGTSISTAIQSAAVAYVSDVLVFEDGSVPSSVMQPASELYISLSTGKPGLLILQNQYANSINKVTTFFAEYQGQNGIVYSTISKFLVTGVSGVRIEKLSVPFFVGGSLIIEKTLPDGISINNNWIIGTIITDVPFYWESPVSYMQHNGVLKSGVMTFAILPNNIDISALDQNDPAVKITLAGSCGEVMTTSPGGTTTYGCDGNCEIGSGQTFCHDACNVVIAKDPGTVQCSCFQIQCF